MKKYPSRLLVKLVNGHPSPEIENMEGIYKLQLDSIPNLDCPFKPIYSHISNSSYTLIFSNSGWEFRVVNINENPRTKVIYKMKEAKNYFNEEVWRNNNGSVVLTDSNITFHLIAFWLEVLMTSSWCSLFPHPIKCFFGIWKSDETSYDSYLMGPYDMGHMIALTFHFDD